MFWLSCIWTLNTIRLLLCVVVWNAWRKSRAKQSQATAQVVVLVHNISSAMDSPSTVETSHYKRKRCVTCPPSTRMDNMLSFFWTGHYRIRQKPMKHHLPVAAGPDLPLTLPMMSTLGPSRKTSSSRKELKSSKKKTERPLNELNLPSSWTHVLGGCTSLLLVYELCGRQLLLIKRVRNINDFLGMLYASLSRVLSIGWTLPISSWLYRNSSLRTSFVGGDCLRGVLWKLRLLVCRSRLCLLRLWPLSIRSCLRWESWCWRGF